MKEIHAMPKSKSKPAAMKATVAQVAAAAIPEPDQIIYSSDGLNLTADLPNGEQVTVPMSLTGDDLDRLIPMMAELDAMESGGKDVAEMFSTFRAIFPPEVWAITGALPVAWCMDIRGEWVQRIGALVGKARLG